MFSFGLIKTHTTASGALLKINDAGLHAKVIELNEKLPRQTKRIFIKKLFKLGMMRFLTSRVPFTFFYKIVELAGYDPDHVLSSFTRGFQSKQMLEGIRHRPCFANLRFIEHRLRTFDPQMIEARTKRAQLVLEGIPAVMRIGGANFNHSHWVLPVETARSDGLVRHLRMNGFDVTKKASSLVRIGAPKGDDGDLVLNDLVYLPFCPGMDERECQHLRDLIVRFTVTKG
ncbi:MAG: hypothetical protein JWM04_224 [Verrucomicrobiales bacterium]|nr:hypothetical protein [Verrucomicrobiales bacterium]